MTTNEKDTNGNADNNDNDNDSDNDIVNNNDNTGGLHVQDVANTKKAHDGISNSTSVKISGTFINRYYLLHCRR